MSQIPVIRVKLKECNDAEVIINEDDFDPANHEKVGEEKPVKRGRKKADEADE